MSGALPPPEVDDQRIEKYDRRREVEYDEFDEVEDRSRVDARRDFDERIEEVRNVRDVGRPRSTVLVDEEDDQGRRRVIEEVDADGKKRIVEEKYVLRRRA